MEAKNMEAKIKSLLIVTVAAAFFVIMPTGSSAKETVSGVITDKIDRPVAGVRVRLFDSDATSADDLMAPPAFTNDTGYYKFHYEGRHWDTAPHGITKWRPDIYIKVSAPVYGRCDNGEWNADANWEYLDQSRVFSDHKIAEDLVINLKLKDYPADITSETFVRGENMWSEVDFFFHYTAFGCAQNGDKVSWSGTGIGGPPTRQTRCWVSPNPKCSAADQERIRALGRAPYPTEPQRSQEPLQTGTEPHQTPNR
ncbi:MAG: hypothetical protein KJ958_06835 [Gammaproteobacteria bacterium]|nr:hypothetical protein [Gammaproteobacteria bacterium]